MSMHDYGEAPGITQQNIVEEGTPSTATLAPIGILGTSRKGSLDLTLVGNEAMSRNYFGKATENNSAVKAMEVCLANNKRIWFKRVVSKNAAKAVSWVLGDSFTGTHERVEGFMDPVVTQEGHEFIINKEEFSNLSSEEKALWEVDVNSTGEEGSEIKTGTYRVSFVEKISAGKEVKTASVEGCSDFNFDKATGRMSVGVADFENENVSWWGVLEIKITLEYQDETSDTDFVVVRTSDDPSVPYPDDRPKCVFTAKEISEELNGCVASVTVTGDKVVYELLEGKEVLERMDFYKEQGEEYIERAICRYSKFLYVEILKEAPWESYTAVLGGGNSGMDITEDDIVEGIQYFADNEQSDVSTFIIPGWSSPRIWAEAYKMVSTRGDCAYIPSIPIGLKPGQVADLVKQQGEFHSIEYMRMDDPRVIFYWPNGLVKNEDTGRDEVVDITPYIASAWSRSDNTEGIEFAPAGIERGKIQGLSGLECYLSKRDRDMLYHETVNVNSVIRDAKYGIVIHGVRTSKVFDFMSTNKTLRYVNAQRMIDYLYRVINEESKKVHFGQNYRVTWNKWKMNLDPHFSKMKDRGGLYDYQIIMDETTVSQQNISDGEMPGIVRVAIIKPNEYIRISFKVAADGITSFNVEEEG